MCKGFKLTEAKHRSGVIAEQIQRKLLTEKEKKELPKLRANPRLIGLTNKRNKLSEEMKRIDKELKETLQLLGLKDETWYDENYVGKKRWVLDQGICLIPTKALNELQRATDLQALGKNADAQKIWAKIIQEYQLGAE